MSFIKILFNNVFVKNILIAIVVITFALIATFVSLNIYTNHGEYYPVPDFRGLTQEQFSELIKEKGFRYNIIDSAHVDGFLPGAVIEQIPAPGSMVKENRNIHFTIKAIAPERVQIPNLIDYSLRNAKVILESYGLVTGELIYVPSEYRNLVLQQLYKGKPVEPGTVVLKGSVIDLHIGKGLSTERTNVPDLTALTLEEAQSYSVSVSLNVGAVIYDESVQTAEDSTAATIWQQQPSAETGERIPLGSSIDIWLSVDTAKVSYQ
ncbi:PASTA domain-containing protein [Carboxylicivirga marina]|uniref:PASTA domain-containing protein n=1 Tax=Carboxylicivirga marina TaxID=2800988 RepID=A0ABS1HH10_9BACT|nr:PASTA domain-containing protein [Carboxylicivirga marina]MBK3516962.1 PASTA domain-containing protein [Carboxylicivirga marina]